MSDCGVCVTYGGGYELGLSEGAVNMDEESFEILMLTALWS